MISFYLAYFAVSAFKAPKWSMIWSDKHLSDSELSEIKAIVNEVIDDLKKQCLELEEDYKDMCIDVLDNFVSIYPNNVESINSEISKITKNVELLYIISGDIKDPADFSKLKKQMMVLFISKSEVDSKILSKHDMIMEQIIAIRDGLIENGLKLTEQSMIQLSKSLHKNRRPKSSDYDYDLNIRGKTNNKISFLIAVKYNFIVHDQDLYINSIYMNECSIDETSFKIKSDFLLADYHTHVELFGYHKETESDLYKKFETKQYSFVKEYKSRYLEYYEIDYTSDSWCVVIFYDSGYSERYCVPYKFSEVFSVISQDAYIVLFYNYKEMADADELKPLNLTILNNDIPISLPFQADEKELIEVKLKNDNWKKHLKLLLTFDQSKYEVEEINNEYIKVSKEQLYEYGSGDSGSNKSKAGMIAGIVVAVVFVIAIVVIVVIIVLKKKKDANNVITLPLVS